LTIGLILNESKDAGLAVLRGLVSAVRSHGGEPVLTVSDEFASQFRCPADLAGIFARESSARSGCDALISVGGDGTLIKAAKEAARLGLPILGVNLGSLGYLTEVEASEIDVIVDRIFSGDYHIEERMMLAVSAAQCEPGQNCGEGGEGGGCAPGEDGMPGADGAADADGESGRRSESSENRRRSESSGSRPSGIRRAARPRGVAPAGPAAHVLNEVTINRGAVPHLIKLKLYVNGTLLDVYPCDGVLVSTPTGSTGYALSAGGPVIDPALNLICVVPICAHMIFSKPVLIAPDKAIKIVYARASGSSMPASLSMDGHGAPDLAPGGALLISRSPYVTKMLRFSSDNFYLTLKSKLHRRGEELYREES
jgi:NAD+ kinase